MPATVLVVEHDSATAAEVQQALRELGYSANQCVRSGPEALEAVTVNRPDLVLMDFRLEGEIDGIETAEVLREWYDVPIVYLTSDPDDATLARAKETEPFGYLLKPFSLAELRSAVEVALQRHDLQSRLMQRERWFSTTLQSIGDAVIATDREQVITFMNRHAETLTGVSAREGVGLKLEAVLRLSGLGDQEVESPAARALRGASRARLPESVVLLPTTGPGLLIEDSAAPIEDDKGNVLGAVVVFRDVSESRRLEQRVAQAERLAAIGSMAAAMGHEINNPMAYVASNVAYAKDALQRLEQRVAVQSPHELAHSIGQLRNELTELSDALCEAHEGTERVRTIVQDLRKFSRADVSPREPIEITKVLESAIKLTHNTIRHHAQLTKRYRPMPRVLADDGQLAQVFMNLLVNAAQATGEGNAESHEISIGTGTDDKGRAVVEISDTGSGIAPKDLARVFDPFFTTKPIGTGMGLGLAICHSTVTGLGGEIIVESELGKGTTVRVTLPAASPLVARGSQQLPAVTHTPIRRGRILVVDDEPAVGRSIRRLLRTNHEVVVETDARAALARIAAKENYDVVFCDVMMPTMTGADLYEAVLAIDPDVAKRFVFLTGGAFSDRARAFLEGMKTVLPKPFAAEALHAAANVLIASRAIARA
jgi:PAS domain S-box-containing protein